VLRAPELCDGVPRSTRETQTLSAHALSPGLSALSCASRCGATHNLQLERRRERHHKQRARNDPTTDHNPQRVASFDGSACAVTSRGKQNTHARKGSGRRQRVHAVFPSQTSPRHGNHARPHVLGSWRWLFNPLPHSPPRHRLDGGGEWWRAQRGQRRGGGSMRRETQQDDPQ